MSDKQKSDFVVSDRRKFTESGELRPESGERESGQPAAKQPETPPAAAPHIESQTFTTEQLRAQAEPVMASAAEQQRQQEDYNAGARKLDDLLHARTGRSTESLEMTFERLVASLYMTAMLQIGVMAPEGEQPRVDVLGARQTIDTLGLLSEKTRGNLTAAEQSLLQQSLFELRMAFLELTNAIAQAPVSGGAPGAATK